MDEEKLGNFMNRALNEAAATYHAALVVVGDKLGLYKTLAKHPQGLTSTELARETDTAERNVREWLASQTVGEYVIHDPETDRYSMSDEAAVALADPNGPALAGLFYVASSVHRSEEKVTEAFKTGKGVGWGEHDPMMFCGVERFFRPGYAANLVQAWIPALEGVEEKLLRGATVADVGCGPGITTIIMGQAFPKSSFVGFDFHAPSVDRANRLAAEAGLEGRVKFEVASAKDFPGSGYDLVACFDCLHDMGDPQGTSSHVLSTMDSDGSWLIVEPFANDTLEENLNTVGRLYYSASTMICTPASLSQEVGLALGAQAGEKRIREVVKGGGFSQFRRAAETPFNLIYEAKP